MSEPLSSLRRGRPSAAATRAKMADVLRVAREQFVLRGYSSATMDEIAAAAGVTKRTLYQWHGDKAALFRACIIEGAERFPAPDIDPDADTRTALRDYAVALVRELAGDYARGMGLLFLREGRDFPDLAAVVQEAYEDYLIHPLAAYLRSRSLEREGSTAITRLFAAMIQAQVHDHLLTGATRPAGEAIERHAELAVDMFLQGNPLGNC